MMIRQFVNDRRVIRVMHSSRGIHSNENGRRRAREVENKTNKTTKYSAIPFIFGGRFFIVFFLLNIISRLYVLLAVVPCVCVCVCSKIRFKGMINVSISQRQTYSHKTYNEIFGCEHYWSVFRLFFCSISSLLSSSSSSFCSDSFACIVFNN